MYSSGAGSSDVSGVSHGRAEGARSHGEGAGYGQDLYNGYGLEGNQELSDVIIYENEEVSCYADRILRRFSYDESQVQNTAGAVQGMKDQNPSLEHIYVMPVPPRVALEEGLSLIHISSPDRRLSALRTA